MPISEVTRSVDLNIPQIFLPHPAGRGIDAGYYVIYSASNAANTINLGKGLVKGYKWGSQLPTSTTDGFLQLDGTIQIVSESLSGSNDWIRYHGSNIIHIGAGANDITETVEDDALFFSHLGQYGPTNATNDDFFYWDRLYLAAGDNTWNYYQYHAHNPTSYVPFNNGRFTLAAENRHGPVGAEEYAHMINVNVKSGATNYMSVMARVHTPSVGGAHNSHNDLELPAVTNKNYMMGGIMNGTSDRFHAFYITANGADWEVYSRTFNYSNGVFNAEVSHGTYDLADPQLARTPGSSSLYPFRASAGKLFGNNIYIPVLYRSGSSGFDVKVWDFASANNLGEVPNVTTIITGSSVRPDCHLSIANNALYAAVSDVRDGGVSLYKLSGSNWVDEGQIVTNNNGKYLRVHGLDFNAEEFKFYVMISGDASGSGTTYSGSGVYSFTPDIQFLGYTHLDYVSGSNSFIVRDALEAGYVKVDSSTGTLIRSGSTEPRGINLASPVLLYENGSNRFIEKRQVVWPASEEFTQGIELQDGRQLFVGTKTELDTDFDIVYTNGIIGIFSPGNTSADEIYEIEGRFDDTITSVLQSTGSGLVYIAGFTKDLLVPRRNLFIHGIGRGLVESMTTTNKIEFVDMELDSFGGQYYVGNHIESSSIVLARYDADFNLSWQKQISGGTLVDSAYGISKDQSGNIYVVGKTTNSGSGNEDALVMKLTNSGSLLWTKLYGTSDNQYASSVSVITSGSDEYVIVPVVSGSSTTVMSLDISGSVLEQYTLSNFVVNRVREHATTSDGKFILSGHNNASPKVATFGVGSVNNSPSMMNWIRTYSSASADTIAYDMRNTGTALEYMVVGKEGNDAFAMKVLDISGNISESWKTSTSGSVWYALSSTPASVPSSSRNVYVVGYASSSGDINQGNGDGIIAAFNHTGSMNFINAFGHTGNDALNAIEIDSTQYNYIASGWSESHSDGRRGILFRFSRTGFGTGNYHLEGAAGMAMWYTSASALLSSPASGTLSSITTPSNINGNLLVSSSSTYLITGSSYVNEIYEGSQVFDAFFGILNLNNLQNFKNSSNYIPNSINRINELFTFFQIGAAGNGEADDGNIFAYDLSELSDGRIAIAAQTSGDIVAHNIGTTGVYDYLIAFYDPTSPTGSLDSFVLTQKGTEFDEEIYALTELSDGRVAFCGRTVGNLGGEPVGGYDIFLGIVDPNTLATDYYTTGSGLADRALNVHDIHSIIPNTLALVYETSGDVGGNTNLGAQDIGIILFNYSTDTWGAVYQIGTTQNESLNTFGKPSAFLNDGRIAVVGSTTGVFADDGNTFGASDIFLGIFDITTGTWKKYQVGTGAADFGNSVTAVSNNKLLIAGSTAASFPSPNDAITVSFDAALGLKGKIT